MVRDELDKTPGEEWGEFYSRRKTPAKPTDIQETIREIVERLEDKEKNRALGFLREAESAESVADKAGILWAYRYITNSDYFRKSAEQEIEREFSFRNRELLRKYGRDYLLKKIKTNN